MSNEESSMTSTEEFFRLFDYYVERDRLGQEEFFFKGCRAILNCILSRRLANHHEQVEQLLKDALSRVRENPYQTINYQNLLDFRLEFESLLLESESLE